ncbi:phosphoglycerol transferase [Xylocopilactobacillus apis]|uniref:Phosphoglycerol transferase n=1 Tax=Xylocopilactobacillus apis TaxID=2932183 RepID=A0AAU9DKC5_9LACO|nr:LTA synthase family protein [Xylocopilactobacillus apis]BDR57282.1 phosphoglycerol transferase [Xylocopilactobacillus apis]
MNLTLKKLKTFFFEKRIGFYFLAVILYVLKTDLAYLTKFSLGAQSLYQQIIMLLNPIATAMLLLGIGLLFKGRKSYYIMLFIDFLMTTLMFANILYYREFSDFLTIELVSRSSQNSGGLGGSIAGIFKLTDLFVYLDIVLLIVLIAVKVIKLNPAPIGRRKPFTYIVISFSIFCANLSMAYSDRSGLLTRTFDNNYIVKYLGLNFFTGYNTFRAQETNAVRSKANASDLTSVTQYIDQHRVPVNPQYFGKAKGKNVIIFHLESFQQFLIDFKYEGKVITPNINALFHNPNSISFDNFFNQIGEGKTSDAEMMMENSLFGLPAGSAMLQYGGENTFNAAPDILSNHNYKSAVFHGGAGSFWNRDATYKSWGYDAFMSLHSYPNKKGYYHEYGIKDKIFLKTTAPYLEQLPQPFYSKIITVSNHYAFDFDKEDLTIDKSDTGDKTVDGYIQTAHYLDEAVGEFMNWFHSSGLSKNTMIVFYGDHFGISDNHKPAIRKLLDRKHFGEFDDVQFQRVPLIVYMPGLKGKIDHTYGGEIDFLPTLLDLMGIDNTKTLQFGQDLLSGKSNQVVAMRNGNFVTPKYTKAKGKYYLTKNGKHIASEDEDANEKEELSNLTNAVTTQLSLSDRVIQRDLLRFYKTPNLKKVDRSKYSYTKNATEKTFDQFSESPQTYENQRQKLGIADPNYITDAPELITKSERPNNRLAAVSAAGLKPDAKKKVVNDFNAWFGQQAGTNKLGLMTFKPLNVNDNSFYQTSFGKIGNNKDYPIHPLENPLILYHSKSGKTGLLNESNQNDIDFNKPFTMYLIADDGNVYEANIFKDTFPGVYNGLATNETQMVYYTPLPHTSSMFLKLHELIESNHDKD